MDINKDLLFNELENCKKIIRESKLPLWDELPKLELYMDQVVMLLNEYLAYIFEINSDEKSVTSSMINNYVKMKIIPAPIKKKYSRIHLSRLIMICSLKKSLSIPTVYKILPDSQNEEESKNVYNAFVKSRQEAVNTNVAIIENQFDTAINSDDNTDICNMITKMAIASDLHKLFTEKFTEIIFKKDEPEAKKQEK